MLCEVGIVPVVAGYSSQVMRDMIMNTWVAVIITLVIAMAGAARGTAQTSANVIVPLSIGNYWIYEVTLNDTANTVVETRYDTVAVVSDTMVNSVHWFCLNKGTWVRNTVEGYYYKPLPQWSEQLVVPYPAVYADEFNIDTVHITRDSLNGEPDTLQVGYRVVSTNATITVPEGTYTCYDYKPGIWQMSGLEIAASIPDRAQYWFAPQTGLIQQKSVILLNEVPHTVVYRLAEVNLESP